MGHMPMAKGGSSSNTINIYAAAFWRSVQSVLHVEIKMNGSLGTSRVCAGSVQHSKSCFLLQPLYQKMALGIRVYLSTKPLYCVSSSAVGMIIANNCNTSQLYDTFCP